MAKEKAFDSRALLALSFDVQRVAFQLADLIDQPHESDAMANCADALRRLATVERLAEQKGVA